MHFCYKAFAICNLAFLVEARPRFRFIEEFDFNSNIVNVNSAAENCKEFELGKTTINDGAPLLLSPCSISQDEGKTRVFPVLPSMVPLNVTNQSSASNTGNCRFFLTCTRFWQDFLSKKKSYQCVKKIQNIRLWIKQRFEICLIRIDFPLMYWVFIII